MEDLPPALDAEMFGQLKELEAGSPGFLADLVKQFLDQATRQFELVRTLLQTKDGEGVFRAAHLLKGSAGSMGALPLMDLLRELEAAGQKRAFADAEALMPRLDREFARVQRALEKP
ncbi:MAG TPA: Hpt domain-containing protein [Planctomycetota bacterium]